MNQTVNFLNTFNFISPTFYKMLFGIDLTNKI